MEQAPEQVPEGEVDVVSRGDPATLFADAFHFAAEDLMEVLAQGHDGRVHGADRILFLEADGRLPDQGAGVAQRFGVGRGAARWTDSSVMSSTPGSSATCGSKSWLGARSMTVSGRSAPTRQRARAAASMRAPEPLQPMTRSAPATAAGSCRAETARPPRAATKASARPEWEKTEMSEYLRVFSSSTTHPA